MQLALVGSMASDDPEGWDYFNATIAHAGGDPDIHILNNFNNVGAIEVNAFQSHADVVIQKSTREGFGLTVSEAIWKGRPFIGGNVGGIPLQVQNGDLRLPRRHGRGVRRALARHPRGPGAGQGARPPRQGARPQALPHAALPARLPEDHARGARTRPAPRRRGRVAGSSQRMSSRRSSSSPTAGRSRSGPAARSSAGRGGLVTALTGLASHREVDVDRLGDDRRGRRAGRARPAGGRSPSSRRRAARTRCGSSPPTRRPTSASTTSSRTRCCGSSSTTSGTSRTRRTSGATRSRRSSTATTSSTRTWPRRWSRRSTGVDEPVVMVHDYHLYTLPALVRRARPDVVPAPLHPHPVDAARRVARAAARDPARDLRGPARQRHRRLPHAVVPLELPAVLPRPDGPRGRLRRAASCTFEDREVWVRAYPLPIDARGDVPRGRVGPDDGVRGRAARGAAAST